MTDIPLPGILPEAEPSAAERKDFSTIEPAEYVQSIKASARSNPHITEENWLRTHNGLPALPTDLNIANASSGAAEAPVDVVANIALDEAQLLVRTDTRPLFGLPKDKDRIAMRQKSFYKVSKD